jgi:hypothetical protein
VATITEWLASLGLPEYAQRFAENGIDVSVLRYLTDQDLEKIGVLLGHRRKMLAAIAELSGVAPVMPQPASPPEEKRRHDAERRHLTIMFCDLVGSTALATRLDPEELQEIIGGYHRRCADVITESGGFVARYLGDGVLAYFGYPRAHEDDAERAVRAGWNWSRLWVWGTKSPSAGFVIDNREPSPSATAGLGGGVGCFTFLSGPFWRLSGRRRCLSMLINP